MARYLLQLQPLGGVRAPLAGLTSAIVLVCIAVTLSISARGESVYQLSRLTVDDLCGRLNGPDPSTRENALICLGLRYEKPGVAVNGYGLKGALEPELPIPTSLISKVDGVAATDPCLKVRAAALDAMGRMMFRTNISTLISRHLSDTNVFVKLKAAAVLIGIYEDSHREPVPELVPALMACLDPNGDPEAVWQAAWYLGRLGPQAKAAVPDLEKARKHRSKKVRHYVSEALSKIRGRGT